MAQMLGCFIDRYGDARQVRMAAIPRPVCGRDDVLVRVRAASVNPIDFKLRAGQVKLLMPHPMPLTLGSDFAGEIVEIGAAAAKAAPSLQPGVRIAARLWKQRIGAFAEYALVRPADLAIIPDAVEYGAAAAVCLAGLTAHQVLSEALNVRAGERVLIHAGAGGVGHLAVQLAKRLGAHVSCTASEKNHAWLSQLGADHCIDYRSQDFRLVSEAFDAALDTQGGQTLQHTLMHTRRGGRVRSIGGFPTPNIAREFNKPWLAPVFWWLNRRERAIATRRELDYQYFFMREDGAQLAELLSWVADGSLHVEIAQRFALTEANRALELCEKANVRGKIVIEMP